MTDNGIGSHQPTELFHSRYLIYVIHLSETSIYLSFDESTIVTGSSSGHQSQSGQGVEASVDCGRGSIPGTGMIPTQCSVISSVVSWGKIKDNKYRKLHKWLIKNICIHIETV